MSSIEFVKLDKVYKGLNSFHAVKGVDLSIRDGEFVVFVGPSGCGKSTLLRMIAGLEDISGGDLYFGKTRVNALAPKERGIGMVFQSYALYPHMSVYDNMAFGLTLEKKSGQTIDQKVREVAGILQLDHLLERKPKELSGGQRQRVAIGRAIVRQPNVFLFDEPLSNLDASLRVQMRIEITKLHQKLKTTSIYVTHDQIEAMTMADEIVVLNAGRIEQVGAPIDLYDRPANLFVAGFIGSPKMNLIGGRIAAEMGAETIGVRPEHIGVSEAGGTWSGTVTVAEHVGSDTFLYVHVEGAGELSVRVVGDIRLGEGAHVHLTPEPGRIHRFNQDGKAIGP